MAWIDSDGILNEIVYVSEPANSFAFPEYALEEPSRLPNGNLFETNVDNIGNAILPEDMIIVIESSTDDEGDDDVGGKEQQHLTTNNCGRGELLSKPDASEPSVSKANSEKSLECDDDDDVIFVAAYTLNITNTTNTIVTTNPAIETPLSRIQLNSVIQKPPSPTNPPHLNHVFQSPSTPIKSPYLNPVIQSPSALENSPHLNSVIQSPPVLIKSSHLNSVTQSSPTFVNSSHLNPVIQGPSAPIKSSYLNPVIQSPPGLVNAPYLNSVIQSPPTLIKSLHLNSVTQSPPTLANSPQLNPDIQSPPDLANAPYLNSVIQSPPDLANSPQLNSVIQSPPDLANSPQLNSVIQSPPTPTNLPNLSPPPPSLNNVKRVRRKKPMNAIPRRNPKRIAQMEKASMDLVMKLTMPKRILGCRTKASADTMRNCRQSCRTTGAILSPPRALTPTDWKDWPSEGLHEKPFYNPDTKCLHIFDRNTKFIRKLETDSPKYECSNKKMVTSKIELDDDLATLTHKCLHSVLRYVVDVKRYNRIRENDALEKLCNLISSNKDNICKAQEILLETCKLYCLCNGVTEMELARYIDSLSESDVLQKIFSE